MSSKFIIQEESGEKLYKLIVIRLTDQSTIKIISKENLSEKIHFIIYFGSMDPDTGEFSANKIQHNNKTTGIVKEDFDELIKEILSKMTSDKEVKIHDLSKYKTLREQYAIGLKEDFMNVTDFGGELSNASETYKDQIIK